MPLNGSNFDKIIVTSRMKHDDGYYVSLCIKGKYYRYRFEGQEQWEQYYYHYSYKAHPTASRRTIKFTILPKIKQFLEKE